MKKALIILATLISSTVFAETKPNNMQPKMTFGVFDTSNKVAREVKDNQYSISNKNHQLCWAAFNMQFKPSNQVVEIFKSPSKTNFSVPQGNIVSSEDGKQHTIRVNIASDNNEVIERCWKFDKTDPKGKYSLAVSVNDVTFPIQTFEVIQ